MSTGNFWILWETFNGMDGEQMILENHLSRELTNGTWFLLSLYVLLHLIRVLWSDVHGPIWKQPSYVKLAWGFSLILIGSAIRSGWVWLLLMAEANDWAMIKDLLHSTGSLTYVAIGFGMWGSTCVAKLFKSDGRSFARQAIFFASLILLSALIPIAAHVLLGMRGWSL